MDNDNKIMTLEEQKRKQTVRFRFLWTIIILDILLAGYIAFQIVSVFIG